MKKLSKENVVATTAIFLPLAVAIVYYVAVQHGWRPVVWCLCAQYTFGVIYSLKRWYWETSTATQIKRLSAVLGESDDPHPWIEVWVAMGGFAYTFIVLAPVGFLRFAKELAKKSGRYNGAPATTSS